MDSFDAAQQIRYLMIEACGVLEDLSRGRSTVPELAELRAGLAVASQATDDRETGDAACGMVQAIDEVLERLRVATAAA